MNELIKKVDELKELINKQNEDLVEVTIKVPKSELPVRELVRTNRVNPIFIIDNYDKKLISNIKNGVHISSDNMDQLIRMVDELLDLVDSVEVINVNKLIKSDTNKKIFELFDSDDLVEITLNTYEVELYYNNNYFSKSNKMEFLSKYFYDSFITEYQYKYENTNDDNNHLVGSFDPDNGIIYKIVFTKNGSIIINNNESNIEVIKDNILDIIVPKIR